jgi:hypothetical protein
VCFVQNLKESVLKSQLYYLNLKITFHSWAKENPWAGSKQPSGRMLCTPALSDHRHYNLSIFPELRTLASSGLNSTCISQCWSSRLYVMPYGLEGNKHFGGTYCLHLQPEEHWNLPTSPHSFTTQKTNNQHLHSCQNLKSHITSIPDNVSIKKLFCHLLTIIHGLLTTETNK